MSIPGAGLDLNGFAGALFRSSDDLGAGLGNLGQRADPSPQQQELNSDDWPPTFGGKHSGKPFVWVPPAYYKQPYEKCSTCPVDHPLCAKRKGGSWFNMYWSEEDFNISTKAQSYCVKCYVKERDRCRLPAGAYWEQSKQPHKMLQALSSKPPWMQEYLRVFTNRQDKPPSRKPNNKRPP